MVELVLSGLISHAAFDLTQTSVELSAMPTESESLIASMKT